MPSRRVGGMIGRIDRKETSMRRLAAVPVLAVLAVGVAVQAQAAAETDFFTFLRASDHFAGARGNSEYEREGTRARSRLP